MEKNQVDPELRRLYPGLSDEELLAAEENLRRYVELAHRVAKRLEEEQRRSGEEKSENEN